MPEPITILIADDHDVWRTGLRQVLESIEGFRVVGEANDGRELVDQYKSLLPAVVITDIKMEKMDGYQAIEQLRQLQLPPLIIAMSVMEEEMDIYEVLARGAKGYLLKNARRNDIQDAVEWVIWKDSYYCRFKDSRLKKLVQKHPYPSLPLLHNKFTHRELEIMEGIANQQTTEEMSEALFISPKTVIFHRNKLMKKTGAKNAIGIILFGIRNRLIKR